MSGGLERRDLRNAVIAAIPLHRHLGLEMADEGFAVELPDRPVTRNHLGGQGGAALFAAGEAAGAAAVFDLLAPVRDQVFAVPVEATIRFTKPARGTIVADARLGEGAGTAVETALAGADAELSIAVLVRDGVGSVVAQLDALWHLARRREGGRPAVPG